MTITYTVTQSRKQKMSWKGSKQELKVSFSSDYFVDVSGYTSTSEIDALNVGNATGIPVVNETIYEVDGKILPFLVCRSKDTSPISDNLSRWIVNTKWEPVAPGGASGSASMSPPANLTDITPIVKQDLGETEKVLWIDKNSVTPKPASITPTGNFWDEPVMERIPTLQLKISQYESSISYQTMLDRKFTVNNATYRSKAAHQWLISDVEASEVKVKLASGYVTAALVTYTLDLSPHDYGWKRERGLFDTQYIDGAGKKKLFVNDIPGAHSVGYIESDGSKRADQTGEPDYIQYQVYDETSFSFLQV